MSNVTKKVCRVLSVLPFIAGYFSSMFFLSGCSANNPIIINSEEEFFNMEDKYYKLNCDLDLYGKSWTPLKVKGFNGDGHTISGLMIGSTDYWYNGEGKVASMFLRSKEIKNVTINRCNLVASDVETVSIVGLSVKKYENVKVTKCTITSNIAKSPDWYVVSASLLASTRGPDHCEEISNCSISDCSVSLKNSSYTRCYVSGFDDGDDGIEKNRIMNNCTLSNCSFEVNSPKSDVLFGGICALMPAASEENSIKLNNLRVDNCHVSINAETAKVGGVIGTCYDWTPKEYEGKNIVSSNNTFTVVADSNLAFGGIAALYHGAMNNFLSKNNEAELHNNGKGNIYIGGALGFATFNTKNAVCDNNDISMSIKPNDKKSTYIGGLVGKEDGSLINSFISFKFPPSSFTSASQVCAQASLIKNAYIHNGLSDSEYTELENKSDFINRLSLGPEWSIQDNEIHLDF